MRTQGWRRFGWYVWDQGSGMSGDSNGRLAAAFEFVFHFNRRSVAPEKNRATKRAGEKVSPPAQRASNGVARHRTAGTAPVQPYAIRDSIIRVNRQLSAVDAGGHPAPYPVGVPLELCKSWGGLVYDPFLGSGTTLIAAEQLGRRCFGLEIEPLYCDVIVKRWEKLTGKKGKRRKVEIKTRA